MVEHGPSDPWPTHAKTWWQETLVLARAFRWSLVVFAGHTWGELRCPESVCRIKIFSTGGKNPERVARQARGKIQRCPHGTERIDLLQRVSRRLENATRLTDAAEALILRGEAEKQAELLQEAETALVGDGDATWDEFGSLVDEADRQGTVAAEAFRAAAAGPMSSAQALDVADQNARGARTDMRDAGVRGQEVRELKERADALLARINELRG